MLQDIHDRAQSWIAWVVVAIIIVPLALWGLNSYFEGTGGNLVVAEVGGEEISIGVYRRAVQQKGQQIQSVLGSSYRPEIMEDPKIRRSVLWALIDKYLLAQAVQKNGFRISDEMLWKQLQSIEFFRSGELFDPGLYAQTLRMRGVTEAEFEAEVRREMQQEQLMMGFQWAAFSTDRELDEAVRLQQQQRQVRVLTLEAKPEALENRTVSDAEIDAFYNRNRSAYEIPEQVSIEYLDLSVEKLMHKVVVEEEAIRELYEERKNTLKAEEERHARHILIMMQGPLEKAEATAKEKLEIVQKKLAAGEDFGAVAKEFSDDPGSAGKGGDLGVFPRGVMVSKFEDAVFYMQEGEVSEPVRTEFGYHIIQLLEIHPEKQLPFAQAREKLEKELRLQEAENLFFQQVDTITNLAYESPDSLETVADEAGITVKKSVPFDRLHSEKKRITEHAAVVRAAFSDEVLGRRKNSDPIELSTTQVVWLRVYEHFPAAYKPLDEVRAEVVDSILKERARAQVKQRGDEALRKLNSGDWNLQQAGDSLQISWGEAKLIQRKSLLFAPEIIAAAFQTSSRTATPFYQGVSLGDGRYALVEVSDIQDGDIEELTAETRTALQVKSRRQADDFYREYIRTLRRQAEITVQEENLGL